MRVHALQADGLNNGVPGRRLISVDFFAIRDAIAISAERKCIDQAGGKYMRIADRPGMTLAKTGPGKRRIIS